MNISFLYEHPTWSQPLIDAFAHRAIDLELVNVADLEFDTDTRLCQFDLAINRVNIMPSAECDPQVVFQTLHYLNWLEMAGVRVVNGSRAHFIGASKAMQNGIFSSLGLAHPGAVAIYRQEDALAAADRIGYPVIVKPNIGGSGSGVALYRDREELQQAVRIRALDLGVDRSGLVQQYIESDGYVYRVEILGGELFYSIRQPIQEGTFNYCAADGCATGESAPNGGEAPDFCVLGGGRQIETFTPDESVIMAIKAIVAGAGADVGGVEYFIDMRNGEPCYYDFNPYSNFVAESEALLGFSAEEKYVDFVLNLAESIKSPAIRQSA